MFDGTEKNKDITGKGRIGTGKAAFLGFSPCNILMDHTRISELPIF